MKYSKLDISSQTGEDLLKNMRSGLMRKYRDEIPEMYRDDVLEALIYIARAFDGPTDNETMFFKMFASEIGVEDGKLQELLNS